MFKSHFVVDHAYFWLKSDSSRSLIDSSTCLISSDHLDTQTDTITSYSYIEGGQGKKWKVLQSTNGEPQRIQYNNNTPVGVH